MSNMRFSEEPQSPALSDNLCWCRPNGKCNRNRETSGVGGHASFMSSVRAFYLPKYVLGAIRSFYLLHDVLGAMRSTFICFTMRWVILEVHLSVLLHCKKNYKIFHSFLPKKTWESCITKNYTMTCCLTFV